MNKRRILCVDDLEDICSLICTILSDYEVISAHSKAEGLLKASSGESFDLYLLDYYLPDGTGVELAVLIREFDQETPILFATSSDAITGEHAESVGAHGVLAKHHLSDQLRPRVSQLLRDTAFLAT